MNEPRFEVFPGRHTVPIGDLGMDTEHGPLTGEFVWHFRDANGRITFTGGESFTRREDAHRSIYGSVHDVVQMVEGQVLDPILPEDVLIVDLDETGDVIAPTAEDDQAKAGSGETLKEALAGPTPPTPEDAEGEVPENDS